VRAQGFDVVLLLLEAHRLMTPPSWSGLLVSRAVASAPLLLQVLWPSLIAGLPLLTAGCATLSPRNVLPEASASRIELDGFQNIRFWGDESEEAIFRYEVLHIRRQKQCLIDIPGAKMLAHSPSLNQTRSK